MAEGRQAYFCPMRLGYGCSCLHFHTLGPATPSEGPSAFVLSYSKRTAFWTGTDVRPFAGSAGGTSAPVGDCFDESADYQNKCGLTAQSNPFEAPWVIDIT